MYVLFFSIGKGNSYNNNREECCNIHYWKNAGINLLSGKANVNANQNDGSSAAISFGVILHLFCSDAYIYA